MREYASQINQTQMHNTRQTIPKLKANRFESCLLELKQPKKKKVTKPNPTCMVC